MPETNQSIASFFIGGWQGGWEPETEQSQLTPEHVADLLNVEWKAGAALAKRKGFKKITVDLAAMDIAEFVFAPRVYTTSGLFPNFTQQVHYFNEDDGELFTQSFGELMAKDQALGGSDLVYSSHSFGAAAPGVANYFRVQAIANATFGDKIYSTCLRYGGYSGAAPGTPQTEDNTATGASKPIKFDVQAGTFSRPTVHPLNGATSGFPRARTIIMKYDRIFVANIHSQGVYRYPSRVYWSNAGTSETFETNSFITVGDDGSEITSMVPFGESILIFKNKQVWNLTGVDENTFALYNLDERLGCEATYGATSVAGFAYFFDQTTGVWSYDGARFVNISDPIKTELLSSINLKAAFKANLVYHDRKLFLSVPVGDVSSGTSDRNTRTYVYDLILGKWTKWSYGFVGGSPYYTDYNVTGIGVQGDNNMYVGASGGVKGIFRTQDTYSDNGNAYTARFETIWLNPSDIGDRHRVRRFEAMFNRNSDVVTIDVYRNLDDSTPWQTLTRDPTVTTDEYLEQAPHVDRGLWTFIKFKFSNATAGQQFQVNGMGMTVSARRTLRGGVAGTGYVA